MKKIFHNPTIHRGDGTFLKTFLINFESKISLPFFNENAIVKEKKNLKFFSFYAFTSDIHSEATSFF